MNFTGYFYGQSVNYFVVTFHLNLCSNILQLSFGVEMQLAADCWFAIATLLPLLHLPLSLSHPLRSPFSHLTLPPPTSKSPPSRRHSIRQFSWMSLVDFCRTFSLLFLIVIAIFLLLNYRIRTRIRTLIYVN